MSAVKRVPASSSPVVPQQTMLRYVTLRVANMWLGIAVEHVSDVIFMQHITPVPCAPKAVKGMVNLRGRIVTVMDTRQCLGLGAFQETDEYKLLVVKYQDEYVALMVDVAEEVLTLSKKDQERLPTNIDAHWRNMASGVYTLEKGLLIILDITRMMDQLVQDARAA